MQGKIWNIIKEIESSVIANPNRWFLDCNTFFKSEKTCIYLGHFRNSPYIMQKPQYLKLDRANKKYMKDIVKKWKSICGLKVEPYQEKDITQLMNTLDCCDEGSCKKYGNPLTYGDRS